MQVRLLLPAIIDPKLNNLLLPQMKSLFSISKEFKLSNNKHLSLLIFKMRIASLTSQLEAESFMLSSNRRHLGALMKDLVPSHSKKTINQKLVSKFISHLTQHTMFKKKTGSQMSASQRSIKQLVDLADLV